MTTKYELILSTKLQGYLFVIVSHLKLFKTYRNVYS
jgi:hypothetical protein